METSTLWLWNVVALWVLLLLETALVLALMRQVGRLHLAVLPGGLTLSTGSQAPDFALDTVSGGPVALHTFAKAHPFSLLVFIHPRCRQCRALASQFSGGVYHGSGTPVLLVSTGTDAQNRLMADEHGLSPLVTDDDKQITKQYWVDVTPFAFLIDRWGKIRAKGVINDEDAIAELLEQASVSRKELGLTTARAPVAPLPQAR